MIRLTDRIGRISQHVGQEIQLLHPATTFKFTPAHSSRLIGEPLTLAFVVPVSLMAPANVSVLSVGAAI